MQKKYWLYVLALEQGKYYVGVTSKNVSKRVSEHRHGFMGANWTRQYKPLKIIDKKDLGYCTYSEAEGYETKVTQKYMKKYGTNNVRGGALTYKGNYVTVFRRLMKDDDYETLKYMSVMLLIIAVLSVAFILKR